MSGTDKRQHTRIRFTRKVRLSFEDNDYKACRLKDLSLTGMFVFGDFREDIGDTCSAQLFQVGLSSLLTINANAKVVWMNDEGVGIHFTSMNFDSYMFLQTTLLYEADDPIIIGLEIPENCPFVITDAVETVLESENVPAEQSAPSGK